MYVVTFLAELGMVTVPVKNLVNYEVEKRKERKQQEYATGHKSKVYYVIMGGNALHR